ncbi:glucose-1-phosphate adenylyltransferase family protein [Phycicoccus sonneratiae]|uniref:NTP transferase domain-containing protein n=1 Tax=Phycicoccus sonneratiae TaxID=2807628 RepID=A0ABS2CPW5_9MICO|nr:sugar phosphate nucleotidyltransferase [Phycicoccus sonneraticus]MBM6401880.1 NTP transferase domain-containing protein [Phycicoccus sonneraticus]
MRSATRVLGVVQAGGAGSRMDVLTRERAKPALPFAGSYRLVDFALSTLAGSGVTDVWLSVQYRAGSLHGHVAGGRSWDLDRTRGGLRWLVPEEGGGSPGQEGFAAGNADDLHQYVDAVESFGADVVVVTSADQVLGVDLRPIVDDHLARGVDCTVLTTEVTRRRARDKTVVVTGPDGRVRRVLEKPQDPPVTTIAAEVFVYRPQTLVDALGALRRDLGVQDEGAGSLGDFSERLLPRLVEDATVRAVPLPGYWADCGTPAAYLAAHRDLVAGRVDVVSDPPVPLLTRWPERVPAVAARGARVEDAWLSPGSQVRGTVRRSVIGPGVVVEAGAVVEDSVLMEDVVVRRDARVTTAVLDDRVEVGRRARVGASPAGTRLVDSHVTLLGREAVVGAGDTLTPGARLEPGASS